MFRFIDGLRLTLKEGLSATSVAMTVDGASAARLNLLGIGNHIFLTIRNGLVSEVVKFTLTELLPLNQNKITIAIERNVNGIGVFNFPSCACVEADMNLSNFIGIYRTL